MRTTLLRWWLAEKTQGYLAISPAFVLIGFLGLVPILAALWLSFYRRLPIFAIHEFVGGDNYLRLLGDERFWSACRTTLYFTGMSVTLELVMGLGIALLLHRLAERHAALSVTQVILLIPWAIPTVVSAQMWAWLYHPEYGLLNYLLLRLGVIMAPVNWLADPGWGIHAAILMDVWKTTPFAALLLLAGLKSIPQDLYLSARVDGAGPWTAFRHITLPLLVPVILIVGVFRTMDAVRVFDAVYVLSGGGPGNSTETLSIYTYKALFQTMQFGYGSTLATAMFVIVAALTALYLLLLRRHLQEVTR
jgi:multiple sugar transport system permease protein